MNSPAPILFAALAAFLTALPAAAQAPATTIAPDFEYHPNPQFFARPLRPLSDGEWLALRESLIACRSLECGLVGARMLERADFLAAPQQLNTRSFDEYVIILPASGGAACREGVCLWMVLAPAPESGSDADAGGGEMMPAMIEPAHGDYLEITDAQNHFAALRTGRFMGSPAYVWTDAAGYVLVE